jgi:DedD protein
MGGRGGRARHDRNRVASGLFLLGCLAVLGGAFGLGFVAGRFSTRPPSAPTVAAARAARDPARPAAEPGPALTFYQDLTAPLTSPPPPAKPSKPPKPSRVEKSDKVDPAPKLETAAAADVTRPAPSPGAFTVQVGAYRAKEPADALRARLAALGYEAYVAEVEAPGSVRYRVRVGSFSAREAAQQVADRIGTQGSLSAFVTSR